jgi:hypothetical protein
MTEGLAGQADKEPGLYRRPPRTRPCLLSYSDGTSKVPISAETAPIKLLPLLSQATCLLEALTIHQEAQTQKDPQKGYLVQAFINYPELLASGVHGRGQS